MPRRMNTMALTLLVIAGVCVALGAYAGPPVGNATSHDATFAWIDVYVEAGETHIAAYQLDIEAVDRSWTIVGIEGGDHPAFRLPPYYDPAALTNDRVILAAFSLDSDLPSGRTRLARLHVMTRDDAMGWNVSHETAASADGQEIPIRFELVEGAAP
ncbi:MAG: hypothetical protein AAF432_08320 [Planctomycetota bacterium]